MPRATRTTTSTSGRTARFTRLSSAYVEALQNIELLRAFGAAERQAARFAREADGLADCTMRQLRLSLVDTALGAYFLLSARTAADFKYSLPRHFAVYDAIRLRRPQAARAAMQGMIEDSRTNIRGRRRARKPAR